ncbi:hypothetical protein ANN_01508 [Periplaneta americana]|uniref:Uncharacterized protein n=1 Tax=Periplaneta americana TaxID=6978 RepID=A0ABQ8TTR4_PERAM|nr:hypothetical protein ANN_01508 [Periplaneta americana]
MSFKWRILSNKEVHSLCNESKMKDKLDRMCNKSPRRKQIKRILEGVPVGRTPLGRSRLRYLDKLEKDMTTLKICDHRKTSASNT